MDLSDTSSVEGSEQSSEQSCEDPAAKKYDEDAALTSIDGNLSDNLVVGVADGSTDATEEELQEGIPHDEGSNDEVYCDGEFNSEFEMQDFCATEEKPVDTAENHFTDEPDDNVHESEPTAESTAEPIAESTTDDAAVDSAEPAAESTTDDAADTTKDNISTGSILEELFDAATATQSYDIGVRYYDTKYLNTVVYESDNILQFAAAYLARDAQAIPVTAGLNDQNHDLISQNIEQISPRLVFMYEVNPADLAVYFTRGFQEIFVFSPAKETPPNPTTSKNTYYFGIDRFYEYLYVSNETVNFMILERLLVAYFHPQYVNPGFNLADSQHFLQGLRVAGDLYETFDRLSKWSGMLYLDEIISIGKSYSVITSHLVENRMKSAHTYDLQVGEVKYNVLLLSCTDLIAQTTTAMRAKIQARRSSLIDRINLLNFGVIFRLSRRDKGDAEAGVDGYELLIVGDEEQAGPDGMDGENRKAIEGLVLEIGEDVKQYHAGLNLSCWVSAANIKKIIPWL